MKAVSLTRSYQDIFYQTSDGLTLYARDYDDGTAKPAVLCLHGLTRNSADFHDLALHLADRFRVISVDQRGRGRSEYDPDPARYRPDVYCADMVSLLARLNQEKVVVIGTSMGGIMAMMMAMQNPDIFRAAIINDIGPEINPAGLKRIQGYVGTARDFTSWEEAAKAMERQQGAEVFPLYTAADWLSFAQRTCIEKSDGRIQFAYDPALANPFKDDETVSSPVDMWPFFAALKSTPVLTIRGELSDILSPETVEKMALTHPDFTSVTIPNIGHAPMLSEPHSLEAMDAFLETFE